MFHFQKAGEQAKQQENKANDTCGKCKWQEMFNDHTQPADGEDNSDLFNDFHIHTSFVIGLTCISIPLVKRDVN